MALKPANPRSYAEIDGVELGIRLRRDELARASEEHFTTFSPQAIESAADAMWAWVQSRMMRETGKTGEVPRTVRITVTLRSDASNAPAAWVFDWDQGWLPQASSGRLSRFSPKAHNAVHEKMRTWVMEQLMKHTTSTGTMSQEIEISVRGEFPGSVAPHEPNPAGER